MLQIRHLFVALAAAATILLPFASALPSPQSELASASYKVTAQAGAIVPKVYIVILKEGTTAEQLHAHRAWATSIHNKRTLEKRYDPSILGIKFVYRVGGMIGYCGSFDSSTIAEVISSSFTVPQGSPTDAA